jgi:arsenical pump membrane protein
MAARIAAAAQQAWPAFVLVSGLLLVGVAAHADGLFQLAGRQLERMPGPPVVLLLAGIALVTVVTALLNLDTAVVFLTPILVHSARERGTSEEPFLYSAVFMANASSLYLPGSNLTNLLVLAHSPVSGSAFAAHLIVPALAATVATAAGLVLLFRRSLREQPGVGRSERTRDDRPLVGAAAALAAATLTVALHNASLPVLAVGVVATIVQVRRGRLRVVEGVRAVGPIVLCALFAAAVTLGTVARYWGGPADLLASAGRLGTAAIGATAAVLLNNLPAAVLLSAQRLTHPNALLVGLNLGPNLAMSGSLSALLWLRAARQVGAQTSVVRYSKRGVFLAPLAIAAALGAASLLGAPR